MQHADGVGAQRFFQPSGSRRPATFDRRHRSGWLLALALCTLVSAAPRHAPAQQIPCPVSGGTTNAPNGSFNAIDCEITATGVLDTDGTFTNQGATNATITNNGSVGELVGPFVSSTWINEADATFHNNGFWGSPVITNTLQNAGTVNNNLTGELRNALVHNSGIFNNGGRWIEDNLGAHSNTGTIANFAGGEVDFVQIDNLAGGSIDNAGTWLLGFVFSPSLVAGSLNAGTFVNSGTFVSEMAEDLVPAAGNVFDNTGAFTNTPTGDAMFIGGVVISGSMTNEGNMTHEIGNLRAFELRDGGTFTNAAGGTFDGHGDLRVGRGGPGTPTTITNAGTMNIGIGAFVQLELGAPGVGGGEAVLNNLAGGELNLGTTGINFIRPSGTVNNAGVVNFMNGFMNHSGAIFNEDGGELNVMDGALIFAGTASATVENRGDVNLDASGAGIDMGTFGAYRQFANGTTRVDTTLRVDEVTFHGGTLTGIGMVEATGGSVVIGANAMVAPGNSPGLLTLVGDVDFDGVLSIEIVGAGSFDVLDVTGEIDFGAGSRIDLLLDPTFMPSNGLMLAFLTAAGVSGFENLGFDVFGLGSGFEAALAFDDVNHVLSVGFTAVPVPSCAPLVMVALIYLRRRHSRRPRAACSIH